MSTPELLRVAIADDHYLVRNGVQRALEDADTITIEVVAAVSTAAELLDAVERLAPDAVVTDIRMPDGTEGIAAAQTIRERHPDVGVVVLSQHVDGQYALALFSRGTEGLAYLLKERIGEVDPLVDALVAVVAGRSAIDPEVLEALVDQRSRAAASPLRQLTGREREVLQAMAEGCTNATIAERLHLSESSVEKYSSAIFAKLGLSDPDVHRRVAAVVAFLQDPSGSTSSP
jgi:DNA-binding NarL/FixJ family response regulator